MLSYLEKLFKPNKRLMNEKEFTRYYFKIISKRFPEVKYSIKESLWLTAEWGEEKLFNHFLDNAYREYVLEPRSVNEIVDVYIGSSKNLYQKREKIKEENIVPIIKHKSYLDDIIKLQGSIDEDVSIGLVWEKYNEELIIVYGEDKEKSISYFNEDDLINLNLNRSQLRKLAIDNIKKIISEFEKIVVEEGFMLTAGGTYEASLILLTDIWKKSNFEFIGEITIGVPNRDLLLVVDSNNIHKVEEMKNKIAGCFNNYNHPISEKIYKWNGGKFIVYE